MTTALALRVLWIGVTVGLAGCVPGASCLEQAAGSAASYMSNGGAARWDLPADSTDSSAGYVTGGPVEDARQAIPGTSPPQGLRTAVQCGYLQPEGTLAAERRGSAAPRLHQSSLRPSGPPLHGKVGRRLIRRTAVVRTRMPGGVGGAAS